MAFSLNQITRKKIISKQDDIKQCYFYVKTNSLLTENIKIGLWKYVDYRFKSRNRGRFTQKILEDMTQDLLEKVCMKHIQDIQYSDIELNENEILYQIKRAIHYGATRNIYYDDADLIYLDRSMFKEGEEIDKPRKKLNKTEVQDYFKGLMI